MNKRGDKRQASIDNLLGVKTAESKSKQSFEEEKKHLAASEPERVKSQGNVEI
jgi:hypothetical protein